MKTLLLGVACCLAVAVIAGGDAGQAVEAVPGSATDAPVKTETFAFQAEVNRLMDMIINSLYTNKDIFLRELISNASDALDKLRYWMLIKDSLKNDDSKLEIRIKADSKMNTLSISDSGVGMSKEDLIANLGTVAKSGTTRFVEAAQSANGGENAMGLIGQFGVGFYSAFLVADSVTVTTKSVNDTQWVWKSDSKSGFEVYADPAGETLAPHGTRVTLHLKEDAASFLDEKTLRETVHKYSEFINFPIFLQTSKEVETAVETEEEITPEEKTDVEKNDDDDDEIEVTEAASDVAEKKKTTVKKQVFEWERINTNLPLWTRPMESITEEEYISFYKAIAKDDKAPLIHAHFKAEGSVDFKGLLYIPASAPHDLYDNYYKETNRAIKVYVRRVLLTESIDKDALPQYLNFVKGVVDSEDLPINVNREHLQKDNNVLKTIGKKIARKVIAMLEDLAEKPYVEPEADDEKAKKDAEKDEEKAKLTPYEVFWSQFSRSIKLGIMEDKKNKKKLEQLLRFTSISSPKKVISLSEYVDNMQPNQKDIYYISGADQASVEASPMLEELKKRNFDCLFFVDTLDEYLVGQMTEFDGKKLSSVNKEGLEFGEVTDEEKELAEDTEYAFNGVTSYMLEILKDRKVSKVVISKRLASTPAVVVSTKWGWTSNMERIMRAQAMSDFERQRFMIGGRTLEINPNHPIIQELKNRVDSDNKDELDFFVNHVYDAALINSGFTLDDAQSDFLGRIYTTISKTLGVEGRPIAPLDIPKKPKAESATEVAEDDDEGQDDAADDEGQDDDADNKEEL